MQLTNKEKRAQELLRLFGKQKLTDHLAEYHKLLDTLIYLDEALTEGKVELNEWQGYSRVLLFKFICHSLTIYNIISGVVLSSKYYKDEINGRKIIDTPSTKVVQRAQLESFLMYHYIYVNPKEDGLKELRGYAWIYSGLLQRQDFPSTSGFAQRQRESDLQEIKRLRKIIEGLPAFKSLTPKQQSSLLNSGSGKLFSHWASILKETGFEEGSPFWTLYNYLSMYSHSEAVSVIQIPELDLTFNEHNWRGNSDLHDSKLLICLMISSVVKTFKAAEIKYYTLPTDLQHDIEIYGNLAMK